MKKKFIPFLCMLIFVSCNSELENSETINSYNLNEEIFKGEDIFENTDSELFVASYAYDNTEDQGGDLTFHTYDEKYSKKVKINEIDFDFKNAENSMLSVGPNDLKEKRSVFASGTKKLSIEKDGKSYNGEIYYPNYIEVKDYDISDIGYFKISLTDGVVFEWNIDDGAFSKIAIVLINRSNNNSSALQYIVDNSGYFSVSSTELIDNNYKIGDKVDIYIKNGNGIKINETAVIFMKTNLLYGKIVD